MAAMAMMMAACSSEDMNQTAPANADDTSTTLPFRATIGAQTATRGLTAPSSDTEDITAAWAAGEKIALVHGALDNDGNPIVDVMSVTPVEGATDGSATITGDVTYTKDEDTYLVYVGSEDNMTTFKEWLKEAIGDEDNYNVTNDKHITMALKATSENLKKSDGDPIYQDGTLATIAQYYDYRLGQSALKKAGEYVTLTDSPVLIPQQAIWKLSFTDGTDALAVSEFTINTVNPEDTNQKETYTVKPSEAASTLYIALPAATANYQFEATVGKDGKDVVYTYSKTGITLEAGKYYVSTMAMNAPEPGKMTVSAEGYKATYDSQAHGITVTMTEPATGATIKYGETEGTYNLNESPTYTNAGKHTVYYQVTCEGYYPATGSADVEIAQAAGTISFKDATITKTIGDAAFTNTLTNTGDGTVKYSTTATNVTVNETTGEVTITGVGTATIKATVTDGTNYTYATTEVSYTLTVYPQGGVEDYDVKDSNTW